MSYLQYQNIFKFLLIIFLLFGILYFLPMDKVENDTIVRIVLVIIMTMFIFEAFRVFVFGQPKHEGMATLATKCDDTYKVPLQYTYGTTKEDQIKSGLNYDHNLPGYYLVNNGNFSEDGISYDKVQKLIDDSRYHDLYNQHNFNIVWSPHTHIGKSRGYLNWDKIYE